MKLMASLLTVVLSASLLPAQEMPQGVEMTGTVCDSKCVTQTSAHPACNIKCSQKSGEAVFIDDGGKVTKIANPDKVKGYKGKHIKAKCKMTDDQNSMEILSILG